MKSTNKKIALTIPVLVVIALFCSGRANAQGTATPASPVAMSTLPDNPVITKTPVSGTLTAQTRLQIGAGDLVSVSVFDVPEMAQTIRVNDLGDASLNLIGSLRLAGLTTQEAQALIAEKLKAGNFLVDPQVSVFINEYMTQGVSVSGEVAKPGVYRVLGSRSLLEIISEAGGTTSFAGSEATVEHRNGITVTVRLTKDAREALSTDVQLAPGDKVVIPRAGLVYVLGDVGRPGGFIMGNDGKMSILQALAMAGGTSHTSSLSRSRLVHKGPAGYMETPLQLKKILDGQQPDFQLQAEDVLYIPSSTAKTLLYRTGPSVASSLAGAAIYRGLP